MRDLDAVIGRLEQLEAQNTALRARLGALENRAPAEPTQGLVSRRGLLRRAGAGAGVLALGTVAATAATLGGGAPVLAGNPPLEGDAPGFGAGVTGKNTKSDFPGGTGVLGTSIQGVGVTGESTHDNGVYAHALGDGAGIQGDSNGAGPGIIGKSYGGGPGVIGQKDAGQSGVAVHGYQGGSGVAVHGQIENVHSTSIALYGNTNGHGTGVVGESAYGDGVSGGTGPGRGVYGSSGSGPAGVQGDHNGTGPGVYGTSYAGRGGKFKGPRAQVQLVPAAAGNHPKVGQRGDLFVDKTGRLWFCKTGGTNSVWQQLA